MDSKWWPWIIVGAIVVFFIVMREQGTPGGVVNFFGTPSNPVNPPTSGESFCGVGTIASGAPQPPPTKGCCVATPKLAPPAHIVFPLCSRTRISLPNPRSIQPLVRVIRSTANPIPTAVPL